MSAQDDGFALEASRIYRRADFELPESCEEAERRLRDALDDGRHAAVTVPLSPGAGNGRAFIRGEVLAELLRGRECDRSLTIIGATIKGRIDLDWATLEYPLRFLRCRLMDDIELSDCRGKELCLYRCMIRGLVRAPRISLSGSLNFRHSHVFRGVDIYDGRIGGDLDLRWCRLLAPRTDGDVLRGSGIRVGADMMLQRLSARGGLSLPQAVVAKNLFLDGSDIYARSAAALDLDSAVVSGDVTLGWSVIEDSSVRRPAQRPPKAFSCTGRIALTSAKIGGRLDCRGAQLLNRGLALDGYGVSVGTDVDLGVFPMDGQPMDDAWGRARFRAWGGIDLSNSKIGRNLLCHGARLKAWDGRETLSVYSGSVAGDVSLLPEVAGSQQDSESDAQLLLCVSDGLLVIDRCQIGGYLNCSGAT